MEEQLSANRPIAGIVCEFNPFHNGHAYLLRRAREILGKDAVLICVMSGDFVQRGGPAVFSKFARAEAACRCGADLVIELPAAWSSATAESFAFGAVQLLNAAGISDLFFGAETEDPTPLCRIAELLLEEQTNQRILQRLKEHPQQSYAAARQIIIGEMLGDKAQLLSQPNCILAVEYIKQVLLLGSRIQCHPVLRIGAEHDASADGVFSSASRLRERLAGGENISDAVPAEAMEIYKRETNAGRGPVTEQSLEQAALARLRFLRGEELASISDAGNGLDRRLMQSITEAGSIASICRCSQTRRYPLARVRRILWAAAAGIDPPVGEKNRQQTGPQYLRILAFSGAGQSFLKHEEFGLPVLIRPSAVRQLSEKAQNQFAEGAKAHDFYVLAYGSEADRIPGEDWRKGPCRIETEQYADSD